MPKEKIYWPRCSVCQYMKKNRDFRLRVMRSTYFHEDGTETVMDVVHAFGDPFKSVTMYAHLTRHQQKDKIKVKEIAPALPEDFIEGEVSAPSQHERALKRIIAEGENKILRGEMSITAAHVIQAAKTMADIDKSTKDRRLEAAKAFFSNKNGKLGQEEQ